MKQILLGLTLLLLSVVANAGAILQPVDATTTAGENSVISGPVNAINQSGLSVGYTSGVTDFDTYLASVPTHTALGDNTWYSTQFVTTGFFDLDLGGLQTVQSMALWNESNGSNQGVNAFALYGDVNSDFSTAVLLGNFTATDGLNTAEVFEFAPTEMAFLRIDILSNHGSINRVGIMEIAVEEIAIEEDLADLTISKSDSVDPVTAGTELTYTLRVDNAGPSAATDVVVTDTLPAGVTLVSTTGCIEDPAGVPTCSLGTIDATGFAEFTITVAVDPSTTGIITNSASVATSSQDPDLENNSVTEDTTVDAESDLSITKVASSDDVSSGQTLDYTIEVSNIGPSDATNVFVTDILSPLLVLESTAGCLNDPTGVPECQLGTIAVGASASYTITVTVLDADGTLVNTASVASDAFDPNGDNSTAVAVIGVIGVSATAIPTLGTLGLTLLILLLGGLGWMNIRRI